MDPQVYDPYHVPPPRYRGPPRVQDLASIPTDLWNCGWAIPPLTTLVWTLLMISFEPQLRDAPLWQRSTMVFGSSVVSLFLLIWFTG